MKRAIRGAVLSLSVLLVVVWTSSSTQAQSRFTVDWTNERLTVVAADAVLAEVLSEVARQTGSRFVGLETVSDTLTTEIREAMLFDALGSLLAGRSYVMTLPADVGAQVVVWLDARAGRVAAVDGHQPAVGVGQHYERNPAEAEVNRLDAAGIFAVDAPESSLLAAANYPDPRVRVRALQTLAVQGTKIGVQAINRAIEDEDLGVRGEALSLLLSLGSGPETVQQLGDLLEHTDPGVRRAAAMALGEHAGDEAEFRLQRATAYDDSDAVREMAARMLQLKQTEKENKEKENKKAKEQRDR